MLSGDIHTFFVNDLRLSNRDPGSPVVATELVGTSISSGAGVCTLASFVVEDGRPGAQRA